MFFGSRQPRLDRSSGRDSDRRDRAADETVRRAAHETWRRSAQRVTRAWNAWLAADRPERGERYRRALSREDRQAIVEILRDTKKDLPEYFKGPVG